MQIAQGIINRILVVRLQRGDDIMGSIREACRKYDVKNGVIMSVIGSLTGAKYYDPVINPKVKPGISYVDPLILESPVEVLSAHGEICHREDGEVYIHVHATFADSQGNAYGGHLADDGNPACTTINIFIGIIDNVDMVLQWEEIMGSLMFFPKEIQG